MTRRGENERFLEELNAEMAGQNPYRLIEAQLEEARKIAASSIQAANLLNDDNARLRSDLADAVAILKQLEWNDNYVDRYGKEDFQCPVCEALQSHGHSPDCELAALLKRLG